MKSNTFQLLVQRGIAYLLGALLTFFCIVILQNKTAKYWITSTSPVKIAAFAVLMLCVTVCIFLLYHAAKRSRAWRIAGLVLFGVVVATVVCGQFMCAAYATTPIGWDVAEIYRVATAPQFSGEALQYLVRYPNNFMLAFLYRAVSAISGVTEGTALWTVLNLCNVVVTDAMLFLTALLSAKIWGGGTQFVLTVLGLLLIGCSPWILVPYTDLIGALAVALLLCCLCCCVRAATLPRKLLWAVAASVCAWFGYNIKGSVLVLLVAIFCVGCVYFTPRLTRKSRRIKLYTAVCLTACAGVCFALLQTAFLHHCDSKLTPAQQAHSSGNPLGYFFLTGLNTNSDGMYGNWWQDVVTLTDQYADPVEQKEALRKQTAIVLSELGPQKVLTLYANKVIWSSIDGNFFYGLEGNFHAGELQAQSGLRGKLQNFTYVDAPFYREWFSNFLQGVWLAVCVLIACGCFLAGGGHTRSDWVRLFSRVVILGMLCYIMLFEARSRYLLIAMPLYLLLAADGAALLVAKLQAAAAKWFPRSLRKAHA